MLENIRNFGIGFFNDLNDLIPARSEFFEDQDNASEDSGGLFPKLIPDLTEKGEKKKDLVISALNDAGDDLTPDFSNAPQVATKANPFSPQQYQAMLAQMVQQQPGMLQRFMNGLA
jgi:hypothetical protein